MGDKSPGGPGAVLSSKPAVEGLSPGVFPWTSTVPPAIETHFVLPAQVTQEPAEPSREYLFNTLAPLVANATSMREAAGIVSAWCYDHAGFRTTSRWDQGVRTTLRRGFGRCEEAVILFVSALRSVGIPAREAGAPYWQHVNDNHVWAEVWLDGEWTSMEAGNPYIQLTGNVRKAPLVFAPVTGNATTWPEPILGIGPGYTILNVTRNYLPVWNLDVEVTDGQDPVPGARVFLSIFNYGTFRPVASVRCNATGRGSIELGPCSLLATVASDNRTDYAFVDWDPANFRTGGRVALDISRNRLPRGRHLMAFTPPGASIPSPEPWNASFRARMDGLKSAADHRREAVFTGWAELGRRFAAQPPYNGTEWAGLADVLARARGNAGEIMRGLEGLDPALRPTAREYLFTMEDKDLADVTRDQIRDVKLTVAARRFREAEGQACDNATFVRYVLADRVEYEPLSRWRPELARRMDRNRSVEETARAVNRLTASLPMRRRGVFGALATPVQVLDQGFATLDREKGILATAMLRAAGVPARMPEERDFVEYMDHGTWKPLYPDSPRDLGNRNATDESRSYYSPPGGLFLQFLEDGKPLPEKEARYFLDFAISKLDRETGTFVSLEKSLRGGYDREHHGYALTLAPGKYWLTWGRRNQKGEPETLAEPFEVVSRKILHMTVDERP